jgi:hypothetical protein
MSDYIDITKKYEIILKPDIFKLIISVKGRFDELNEKRFCLKIYFSNDNSKDKIIITLQNPSNDEANPQTLIKIIKHYSSESIYSLTIINLFSTIASKIEKTDTNIINEILLENEENINIINEIINEEIYDKCIFGCGQHLIQITKCKNKCIERYQKIIDIIINKNIKTYHFGTLVCIKLLPGHPSRINNKFTITDLDINLLSNNLKSLKKK